MPMTERLLLHEYAASGNCYKVRLTAAMAGIRLERREYDIMMGETRTPEFRAKVNANGRIPVLQVGDRFIPESNAACYFVAEGSSLIPTDPFDHADMLHWMSGSSIAMSRTSRRFASGCARSGSTISRTFSGCRCPRNGLPVMPR
jgi:glutathione S-transferase